MVATFANPDHFCVIVRSAAKIPDLLRDRRPGDDRLPSFDVGPAAAVVLRSQMDVLGAEQLVRREAAQLGWREDVIWGDSVDPVWPRLGEFRDQASMPYAATLEPPGAQCGPEEIEALATSIGFQPTARIAVDAYVNNHDSHRGLGLFVLALAEATGGLVDFGGSIEPPGIVRLSPPVWSDDVDGVRNYVRQMPGVVIEVPYELSAGGDWIYHVVDVNFLRAWLKHPDFHMIK